MAKVSLTSSVAGIRGKIDGWIYREQHGQTVIVRHRARDDKPSRAQLARRSRFREAQAYAKKVLADPLKREAYRRLGAERKVPPNALLISNFLNPPVIEVVDFSAFAGRPGDLVRVVASDLIEVTGVGVAVRNAAGDTLEAGEARCDHGVWMYRCTLAQAEPAALRFEIVARNRAGTAAKKVCALP